MKKAGFIFLCFAVLSCSSDNRINRNNPFLYDPMVNIQLDLSLPQYNQLNFIGGSVIINEQGIKGILVYNQNNSQFLAWELSDPNHAPNECSRMIFEGIHLTCPCPDHTNAYDILTGQHSTDPGTMYPLQSYRARLNGNTVTITN